MKTSPEALALAAFAFVFIVLLGGWQQIIMLTSSTGLLPEQYDSLYAVLAALTVDVPVALAVVGAARVSTVTETAWGRAIAGATIPLGFLSLLGSLLYVLASITGHGHGIFFPRM